MLVSSIASKLLENYSGLLTGDQAKLYEEAIKHGIKPPDLIGRFARSLSALAKPLTNADVGALLPALNRDTISELEKAVTANLNDDRFYIFIDDTDQVAQPDRSGHLNRIWGLLLAVRDLASRHLEVRVVVTLRTEVWERLKRDNAGQRDQTDHFTNLTVYLSSDEQEITEIVERRLSLAASHFGESTNIYSPFFEGELARAPFSDDYRSWKDLILVRSRERPRDAIQLLSALASKAMLERAEKIDEDHFQAAMPPFSENRATYFGQEAELECPQALDVLRSFAVIEFEQGGFRLSAEQTREHLKKALTSFGVTLYGSKLRPTDENDVLELWRFLYTSNVLNARTSDVSQREGFRHLRSEDDPMLVTKARWNDIQKLLWEINPAFRDYLISRQKEKGLTRGLPKRPRTRRRHN